MADKTNGSPRKGFGSFDYQGQKSATHLLKRKARQEAQGYPIATILYYGPNRDIATKVAVGIVDKHQDVVDLKRWLSDGDEIRFDDTVNRQILDFLKRKRVKQVVMTGQINGCPHEEGVDYPEGEVCPQCPYWAGQDRWS